MRGFYIMLNVWALTIAIQYEPTENESGLIFKEIGEINLSYDSYTMTFDFNLTEFYMIPLEINNVLKKIRRKCKNESEINVCIGFLELLEVRESNMNKNLKVLESLRKVKRAKRGLVNFVGRAMNFLFGVSDDEVEEKFNRDIEKINQIGELNLVLVKDILKNQNKTFQMIFQKFNETEIRNNRVFEYLLKNDNFKSKIIMIDLLLLISTI